MFLFVLSPSLFVLRDQHNDSFGLYSDTNHAEFYAVHVRWGRNKPLKDNRLLFKVHDLPLWLCWFVHDRPVCYNMCFTFSYLNKEFSSVALQPESFTARLRSLCTNTVFVNFDRKWRISLHNWLICRSAVSCEVVKTSVVKPDS